MKKSNYELLTHGSIPKVVGMMSVPTIISMLTSSLYSLVDTFFVGQIDTQATAAVGIVFAVLSVFQAFAFFFGHGSGNYMSRMLGAKQRDEAVRMASTGFFTALIFGVVMAVIGLILLRPVAPPPSFLIQKNIWESSCWALPSTWERWCSTTKCAFRATRVGRCMASSPARS